jgi:hypothetical protein
MPLPTTPEGNQGIGNLLINMRDLPSCQHPLMEFARGLQVPVDTFYKFVRFLPIPSDTLQQHATGLQMTSDTFVRWLPH